MILWLYFFTQIHGEMKIPLMIPILGHCGSIMHKIVKLMFNEN